MWRTIAALPAAVSIPIRKRFKALAHVDVAVHHRPQSGAFQLQVNGRPVDIRLSTEPTGEGEQLVMRVIDSQLALPLAGECPPASEPPPVSADAPPRVLIADDEPTTRRIVRSLLEHAYFQVLEAVNGSEAVDIATRERPNLLLLDLNMPVMNGYEAINRLRHDLSLATLPIVVLTAADEPGIERRVLDLGADDFIVKPFDPEVLLARVHAVFRRIVMMAV